MKTFQEWLGEIVEQSNEGAIYMALGRSLLSLDRAKSMDKAQAVDLLNIERQKIVDMAVSGGDWTARSNWSAGAVSLSEIARAFAKAFSDLIKAIQNSAEGSDLSKMIDSTKSGLEPMLRDALDHV